jgi:plastocyanin
MRRILLALCATLALVAAGCGGDDDDSGGGSTTASQPSSSSASGEVEIKMQNIQFAPKQTTVEVGQKVKWVNEDTTDHNVVADSGADFKSDDFGNGASFEFTPDKAGAIKYQCTLHPGMTGTLTVSGS